MANAFDILDEDVLVSVTLFFDALALARFESVCRRFSRASHHQWKALDKQIVEGRSNAAAPKVRVVRRYVAERHMKKCDMLHPGGMPLVGYSQESFGSASEHIEVFVRLEHIPSGRPLWQGFQQCISSDPEHRVGERLASMRISITSHTLMQIAGARQNRGEINSTILALEETCLTIAAHRILVGKREPVGYQNERSDEQPDIYLCIQRFRPWKRPWEAPTVNIWHAKFELHLPREPPPPKEIIVDGKIFQIVRAVAAPYSWPDQMILLPR